MEASLIVVDKPYVYIGVVEQDGSKPKFECMNDTCKEGDKPACLDYSLTEIEGGKQLQELLQKATEDKKLVIQAPIPLVQALCQMFQYQGNIIIVPIPDQLQPVNPLMTPEQAGANAVQELEGILNPTKPSGLILPN